MRKFYFCLVALFLLINLSGCSNVMTDGSIPPELIDDNDDDGDGIPDGEEDHKNKKLKI